MSSSASKELLIRERRRGSSRSGSASPGSSRTRTSSLASHCADADDYGRISLLWSTLFITVSVLYRPVEQLLSRTIADHDARGIEGNHHLRVAATIQLGLGVVFVVVALIAPRAAPGRPVRRLDRALLDPDRRRARLRGDLLRARLPRRAPRCSGCTARSCSSRRAARVMFALLAVIGVASGEQFVAMGMAAAPIVSLVVVPWALAAARRGRPRAAPRGGARQLDAAAEAEPSASEPSSRSPTAPASPPRCC